MHRPERGALLLMQLMSWLALHAGRWLCLALIYPICLYFILFAPRARRASRHYLARILNRPVTMNDVYQHFLCFAGVILDRVYLLAGRHKLFDVKIHGAEVLMERVRRKQGIILLGAHLGSFDALRIWGRNVDRLPLKILMYEDNAQKTNSIFKTLNPELAASIIRIGSSDSLLQVKESLDQGECIGILGDRVVANDRLVPVKFLGGQIDLPGGPLLIASITKAPVILVFGLFRSPGCYDIHIELLADSVDIQRSSRQEHLQDWAQAYASRLEHYCHLAPYNWFNFYDYWSEE